MRPPSRRLFNGTAALIRDVGALELGGTGVDGSVDEGDGDALTCVPLRPSSIQVVVGEVLLRRDHILRTRRGRHHSESTRSQHGCGHERGQGARGAPRPPHTNVRQAGRRGRVAIRVQRVHLR